LDEAGARVGLPTLGMAEGPSGYQSAGTGRITGVFCETERRSNLFQWNLE